MKRRRRQKNFFLTLVFTLAAWSTLAGMVWFIEPPLVRDLIWPNTYTPFFIVLFLALFFTGSVLLANSRRGLFFALGITVYLVLRLWQLGHLLNLLLIAGTLIAADYYFTQKG